MKPRRWLVVLLAALGSGPLWAAEPPKPRPLTDGELLKIRAGFDQRVREAFESQRGKPLKRADKQPPLKPGRGNYVRAYSFSIVDFATRCLALGEQLPEANAALVENAQHYLDNPKDIEDRDSFHWHSEMLLRLIEMYGPKGTTARGRLTPATEAKIMAAVWEYARRDSTLAAAEVEQSHTWHVSESENHHAQRIVTCWHFAKLASKSPEYKDRKYVDGATAQEHYDAWSKYLNAYATERAKKGLAVEVASDNYQVIGLKGFYNVFDFAEDPALQKRFGYLLDLYWALWAQEQFDGILGGGKARIYQGGGDIAGRLRHARQLAWFYFDLGDPTQAASPLLPALTSKWRPPLVVIDLARDAPGRGKYEIHQRPLGLAVEGFSPPPDYRLRTDYGGIHRYAWCTPQFILGTLMFEARPASDWTNISSQNRWQGAIFSAGAKNTDARIVPQVRASDDRAVYNAFWSVQRKSTLITQKLKTCKGGREVRVWFSQAGLTKPVEESGWVFTETLDALAAVRAVSGATTWDTKSERVPGTWLCLADEWSPVILEVAGKDEHRDAAALRKAVAALPLSFENNVLTYKGLGGDTFTFHADQSQSPLISGEPVDYAPPMAFDSPFVRGEWDSGIVTISKGKRKVVLDFNQP